MEVSQLFFCFALFMTAACFSALDATLEHTNDSLTLDASSKDCSCENGKCVTDKQGHSKCVCKPGFSLQDEFTCKPCDCGSLGACIFTLKITDDGKIPSYQYEKKCVCGVGRAENDGVCVDCFCGENSACDFKDGEKRCFCIDGFSEKDGVCTKCDCGFNGECEYENGNKKCTCDEGHLELNGKCEECDCGDHGTCLFESGQKTCKCQAGFLPNNGKCETCDCGSNSVSCDFVDGVQQCKCKDRYADRHGTCEECNCGDYTKSCSFNDNRKMCSCLEGYVQKGETCELGCSARNPCQSGGYCKDGFCDCLKGTRGEFCEVIDECSYLCPNQSDVQCAYDVPSQKAYCRCWNNNLGYDPNKKQCRKTCPDESSCKNQGKCTGTSNQKVCECLEETAGDFCEEVPACSGVNCGTGGYCVFDPSTKKAGCACRNPDHNYDPSIGRCRVVCHNHGDCRHGGSCGPDNHCYCLAGTQGDRCSIVDACQFGHLKCHGEDAHCTFDLNTRMATCKCKNWNDEYDFQLGRCRGVCNKNSDCFNGGSCGFGGFCYCLPGTQGSRCEIIDDCHFGRLQCEGGSVCCTFDPSTRSATCEC